MLLLLTTHHNFFFCGFSKQLEMVTFHPPASSHNKEALLAPKFVIKDQLKMLSVVKSRLKIWMKEDFTSIEKGSMCADLQHFSLFLT